MTFYASIIVNFKKFGFRNFTDFLFYLADVFLSIQFWQFGQIPQRPSNSRMTACLMNKWRHHQTIEFIVQNGFLKVSIQVLFIAFCEQFDISTFTVFTQWLGTPMPDIRPRIWIAANYWDLKVINQVYLIFTV